MKVLQIIDIYKDGGAEKVFDAYNSFCKKEIIENTKFSIYKSDYNNIQYLIHNNSNNVIKKIFQQLNGTRKLSYIIKNGKYNKIVSFLDRSNIMSIMAAKGRVLVVATVHNPPTIQYQKLVMLKKLVFFILKYFYNKKNVHVIAVSQQVKESLERIGVKNVKIVYNPLVVNENRDTNLKIQKPFFISVGRFSYQKAQWKLVKAISILKSDYKKEVNLVLVGDGYLLEKTKFLVDELKIKDLIHFTGFVANPLPLIADALCMIFASYFEGFPITVLESFYCKCPVIGTNVSLPEEIRSQIVYSDFYYENRCLEENFDPNIFEEDDYKLAKIMNSALVQLETLNIISKIGNKWVFDNCSIDNFKLYE